jgi:hypothetical protein
MSVPSFTKTFAQNNELSEISSDIMTTLVDTRTP